VLVLLAIGVDARFNSRLAAAIRLASAASFLTLAGDFFAMSLSTFFSTHHLILSNYFLEIPGKLFQIE
jgi:hypothetical protein